LASKEELSNFCVSNRLWTGIPEKVKLIFWNIKEIELKPTDTLKPRLREMFVKDDETEEESTVMT
jgi:hypothetical protein